MKSTSKYHNRIKTVIQNCILHMGIRRYDLLDGIQLEFINITIYYADYSLLYRQKYFPTLFVTIIINTLP